MVGLFGKAPGVVTAVIVITLIMQLKSKTIMIGGSSQWQQKVDLIDNNGRQGQADLVNSNCKYISNKLKSNRINNDA